MALKDSLIRLVWVNHEGWRQARMRPIIDIDRLLNASLLLGVRGRQFPGRKTYIKKFLLQYLISPQQTSRSLLAFPLKVMLFGCLYHWSLRLIGNACNNRNTEKPNHRYINTTCSNILSFQWYLQGNDHLYCACHTHRTTLCYTFHYPNKNLDLWFDILTGNKCYDFICWYGLDMDGWNSRKVNLRWRSAYAIHFQQRNHLLISHY